MHSYKYNNQYCIPDELVKKIQDDAIKKVLKHIKSWYLKHHFDTFCDETYNCIKAVEDTMDEIKKEFGLEE